MSDDYHTEVSKVYDKIDQIYSVVTESRLEIEKLRGETRVSISELSSKVGPMVHDVANLKMRVASLEGHARFNAGRKIAWASVGGVLMVIVNVCIIFVKEFGLK